MNEGLRKYRLSFIGVLVLGLLAPHESHAFYPELLYRYQHHLFTISPDEHPSWRTTKEVWTYKGQEIQPAAELRVDGDTIPSLPEGITRSAVSVWNTDAIADTLYSQIGVAFNRDPGAVTISRSATGGILFEGVGYLGRELDSYSAARLTVDALENAVYDIHLPVRESQPQMSVLDPHLQDLGVQEVVAIGESNYTRSPGARRHNIAVGLSKFNGHLIQPGATFSFNEVLGAVDQTTGYKKELVILGDRTLPEYGGGLCQVSTTAYRGIWEYGFPLEQRRNHSYAVSYYAPQGTDATIYPPTTDIKFVNDSATALLIQTHTEDDKAYFIYYGSRDGRESEIIGPYTWDHRPPPPDKIEYTEDITPGTTLSIGKAVEGMQAAWFRIIRKGTTEVIEPVYSYYESRPNFMQIGLSDALVTTPSDDGIHEPDSPAARRLGRQMERAGLE